MYSVRILKKETGLNKNDAKRIDALPAIVLLKLSDNP